VDDPASSLEGLKAQAAAAGVAPSDDDLAEVAEFLRVLLPAMREVEELLPPEAEP
jgi:hypothetical protein